MMKFLKTCACLLIAIAIAAIACAVLVHLPGTWNPEERAWGRLPADTRWAVEIHDARALLEAAMRDPGAEAFFAEAEACVRGAAPRAEGGGGERFFGDFLLFASRMGPLFPVALPNAAVIGAGDFRPRKFFIIFQPTVWMRCLAFLSGWDEGEVYSRREGEDGGTICFSLRGGWAIAAAREDVVQRVLDEWDGDSAPLGPCPPENGPHLFFAARRGGEGGGQWRVPCSKWLR